MKMGLKNLTWKGFVKSWWSFWNHNCGVFFVLLSIAALAWGAFFWYQNLYTDFWNDQQKADYRQTKDEGVVFKKDDFLKSLEFLETRKKAYEEDKFIPRDVFKAY